jgi:hypothetical protein
LKEENVSPASKVLRRAQREQALRPVHPNVPKFPPANKSDSAKTDAERRKTGGSRHQADVIQADVPM